MGGLNQNENLILVEDEDEMKTKKYVGRVESGNVQTKNSKVEKKNGINNDFLVRIYMFKEKLIEAMIEMLYVFPSRK
jgi:hypothetical protein